MSSKLYPHIMYALKQGYEALFRGFNIGVVCLSPRKRFMLLKPKGYSRFQNLVGDISEEIGNQKLDRRSQRKQFVKFNETKSSENLLTNCLRYVIITEHRVPI